MRLSFVLPELGGTPASWLSPVRMPDFQSEDRALAALAKEMTENPRNMLQKLVETASGAKVLASERQVPLMCILPATSA